MFTGIINHIGTIESAENRGDLRLTIACDFAADVNIGESIACNGACLTVVEKGTSSSFGLTEGSPAARDPSVKPKDDGNYFTVDLSAETLTCTAPRWKTGERLHLERAMKLGDTLDGHMVSGHVDDVATLKHITPDGDSHILCLEAPAPLSRFIAEKGSVTLDGISLTVNKIERALFWINIIPHTWSTTTLSERKPGDQLNLEIDLIARYVARLLQK